MGCYSSIDPLCYTRTVYVTFSRCLPYDEVGKLIVRMLAIEQAESEPIHPAKGNRKGRPHGREL